MPRPSAEAGPSSTAACPNVMVSAVTPFSARAEADKAATATVAASAPRSTKFMESPSLSATVRRLRKMRGRSKGMLNNW